MRTAAKNALIFTVVMAVITWWSWFWVSPRDRLMNEISNCMAEEIKHNQRLGSRAAYELCYDKKTTSTQQGSDNNG